MRHIQVNNMHLDELVELDNKILTKKEMDELEEHELVRSLECIGYSGYHLGHTWYSVELENNINIDVYCKF